MIEVASLSKEGGYQVILLAFLPGAHVIIPNVFLMIVIDDERARLAPRITAPWRIT